MTKHTPGPWRVSEPFNPAAPAAGEAYTIRHDRRDRTKWNGYVAEVLCGSPNAKANADLLAAAPDMLAALRDCTLQLQYLADKFGETGTGAQVLARVNAAIAKAEGR